MEKDNDLLDIYIVFISDLIHWCFLWARSLVNSKMNSTCQFVERQKMLGTYWNP